MTSDRTIVLNLTQDELIRIESRLRDAGDTSLLFKWQFARREADLRVRASAGNQNDADRIRTGMPA